MLAAYRAGRQAEALRAFQQLRRNLAQELGLEPSPELVELERRLLDHDPTLRAGAQVRAGAGLDQEVAARAGGRAGAASDQVTEYTDALRSIRASSHLKLGLATVAVLITDLVGSASLRTSLGDHRADEIERWHEGILTKAVADYQGTIVKRLGDGAMAVFTTATDAVAAAAAIQTRLARESRTQGGRAPGAHRRERGRSRRRGGRRSRPAADGSRRGCARAPKAARSSRPQLVQHLAAARSAASFLPFGAFELKGLPGPDAAVRGAVAGRRRRNRAVPDPLDGRPSVLVRRAGTPSSARSRSRGTEACDTSGFGTALVTGEAGAGQVPAHFRVRAVDRRRRPHHPLRPLRRGRGVPVPADRGVAPPLPRARVAGRRRHGAGPPRRAALAARPRTGERALRLRPRAAARRLTAIRTRCTKRCSAGSRSSPTAGRCCSCSTTCSGRPARRSRCCSTSSPRRPRFPGMLARDVPRRRRPRTRAGRAARPARPHRQLRAARAARWSRSRRTSSPWSPSRSARAAAEPVRDARRGDPRGVGRQPAVRHVARAAARVRRPDAAARPTRQPVRPPERVMELVVNRLSAARSGDGRAAAEGGGDRHRSSSSRCCASSPTTTDDDQLLDHPRRGRATRAISSSCPDTPLRYRFPHGVVRNALLETVPVSQRMRLHKLAGRGLEQLGRAADDRNDRVARVPLLRGGRPRRSRPRDQLLPARGRCRDPAARARRGRRVVRARRSRSPRPRASPTRSATNCSLALGQAQVCAGDKESRGEPVPRVPRSRAIPATRPHAAEAVLSLNRGFFARTGETDVEAVEALEATLALFADDEDGGTKAALLAALASELVWSERRRPPVRRSATTRSRWHAARIDPRALARVLGLRNMTILAPDTLSERTANCYELPRPRRGGAGRHRSASTPRSIAAAPRSKPATPRPPTTWSKLAARVADQPAPAAASLAGAPDADRAGGVPRRARRRRLLRGRGGRARAPGRAGDAEAFLFHTEQLLEIRRWQGRLDEHLGQLRPFAGQADWDFGYAITRYLYEAGDVDGARARSTATSVSEDVPPVAPGHARRRRRSTTSRSSRRAKVTSRPRRGCTTRCAPFADSFANTTIAKPVGWHYLGLLAATMGKIETAEPYLRKAIGVHDIVGAPLFRAESEIELARVLLDGGRDADAEELLTSALATAEARGSALLARQCEALSTR